MSDKKNIGAYGEYLAELLLNDKKYKIFQKNYRTSEGEVDIVAWDDDVLVFIEVKTRKNCDFGRPSEAVNQKKQRKYKVLAACFLKEFRPRYREIRFDVIEVVTEDKTIQHLKNAFF